MFRGYTGGVRDEKRERNYLLSTKKEITISAVPALYSLSRRYARVVKTAADRGDLKTIEKMTDRTQPWIEGFNEKKTCVNCRNVFTENDTYGTHPCSFHFGQLSGNAFSPVRLWTCCSGKARDRPCWNNEHISSDIGKNYSRSYACLKVSLETFLRGLMASDRHEKFFGWRYLEEGNRAAVVAHRDRSFFRLQLSFLDSESYYNAYPPGGETGNPREGEDFYHLEDERRGTFEERFEDEDSNEEMGELPMAGPDELFLPLELEGSEKVFVDVLSSVVIIPLRIR